jgi:hypothetical protein
MAGVTWRTRVLSVLAPCVVVACSVVLAPVLVRATNGDPADWDAGNRFAANGFLMILLVVLPCVSGAAYAWARVVKERSLLASLFRAFLALGLASGAFCLLLAF